MTTLSTSIFECFDSSCKSIVDTQLYSVSNTDPWFRSCGWLFMCEVSLILQVV